VLQSGLVAAMDRLDHWDRLDHPEYLDRPELWACPDEMEQLSGRIGQLVRWWRKAVLVVEGGLGALARLEEELRGGIGGPAGLRVVPVVVVGGRQPGCPGLARALGVGVDGIFEVRFLA